MSAKDVFEKQLPEAIAKNPAKAKEVNAVYCVNVSGAGGGSWTIDLKANPPAVRVGQEKADCTLEISAADFETLMAKPASAMTLFFSGKLKVSGDQMLAMKLPKVFGL